jgi:hypothetical protein
MGAHHEGKPRRYADRWSQPTDMADYANYVKTITQRYKGVIDALRSVERAVAIEAILAHSTSTTATKPGLRHNAITRA